MFCILCVCGRPWQIEMSGIKLPWTLSVWISWSKDCGSWPWQMYSTDNMTRIQDERERERERERGGIGEKEIYILYLQYMGRKKEHGTDYYTL